MDKALALRMLQEFQAGTPLPGYAFLDLLGHGKSAAVFRATAPDGASRALKVYDPDLATRFGVAVQLGRHERELGLRGHGCRNLVQIFGGGELPVGSAKATYLEMEFVDGVDLRARIAPGSFTDPEIRRCLRELCAATDLLHRRGLCHRDIKTDNIRLRSDGELVLLDLGVLRPVGSSDLTDLPESRHFVGTLRYSPPELLHRREADTPEAWRAIDIYQIGTVLYELVQGVRLFSHVPDNPYADVVSAVDVQVPQVMRSDIGQDLVRLVRNCLLKDPQDRLIAAPWTTLVAVAEAPPFLSASRTPAAESLEKHLREAKAAHASVEAVSLRAAQRQAHGAEVRRQATAIVGEELDLRQRGFRSPAVTTQQGRGGSLVSTTVLEDLEKGFVGQVRLTVYLEEVQKPIGHVQLHGLGLRTRHFFGNGEETAKLIDKNQLGAHFELLFAEAFDAQAFRAALRDWVDTMLVSHLEATKDEAQAEREAQIRLAEQRAEGVGPRMMVSEVSSRGAVWFTRSSSGAIRSVWVR